INPGSNASYPLALTPMGSSLFFFATRPANGYELWKTDGTTTSMVKDINGTAAGSGSPSSMGVVRSSAGAQFLVFGANDGLSGNEPWKSDGTAAGTVRLADLNAGSGDSYPTNFLTLGNEAFFTASVPAT